MYLLYLESADRGPIDLQDAVPRVDGISVIGTDVHPVDPKDGLELRQGKSSPDHLYQVPGCHNSQDTQMKTQYPSQNASSQ